MNIQATKVISGEVPYVKRTMKKFLAEKPHFKIVSTCSHNRVETKTVKGKGKAKDKEVSENVTVLTVTLAHLG